MKALNMAWNQSRVENGESRSENGRKPSILNTSIAIVSVVILVVTGGVAWWALRAREETTRPVDNRRTPPAKIVKATPVSALPEKVPASQEKSVEIRRTEDGRYMKYVDGEKAWMYPRRSVDPPARTNGQHRTLSIEQRIFKYRSDMDIAGLLMAQPGDMPIGEPEYDRYFKREFLKSLEDPAFLLKSDTEEERALKKAVIEVKAELKERYDAGEDLAKIMKEARNELRELGAYKSELEEEVRRLSKDGSLGAEDIEDLVAAANKMLEARGVTPIEKGGFLRHQLRLRNANSVGKGGERGNDDE